MSHAHVSPQVRATPVGRRARVRTVAQRSMLIAFGTIAVIAAVPLPAVSDAVAHDTVSIDESADRFVLVCEPDSQRLVVRVADRTVSVAPGGQAAAEMQASDAEALLYDETSGTVSIHTATGEAAAVATIGPIDRRSWARLQVFILDHPDLGIGPLVQRSATDLQISFPSSPESTLKIDAAGDRLFVEPAGVKGFAPSLSSVRSLTYSGADESLTVDLDNTGARTTVELTPMTAATWKLLTEFVDSRDDLHLALRAR
jgi:hypothetical protein